VPACSAWLFSEKSDLPGEARKTTTGQHPLRNTGRAEVNEILTQKREVNTEKCIMISKELLDILACPKCKGDVKLTEKKDGLICDKCKLLYEIRDDIPVMLIDEAKKIGS